jgi:hypothetical protein
MSPTVTTARQTTPDKLDVIGHPRMAKAHIEMTTALSSLVKEAAKAAHGKQEAAARHLGKNPGNFSRDIDARRTALGDLEDLGPVFLAELGKELVREFGPLSDPKAEARRTIRDIEERLNTLKQFVEVA